MTREYQCMCAEGFPERCPCNAEVKRLREALLAIFPLADLPGTPDVVAAHIRGNVRRALVAFRDLRGRRNEPSASVSLCVSVGAIREGKIYGLRVARTDGKHLTPDDFDWVRGSLGLPVADAVDLAGVDPEA